MPLRFLRNTFLAGTIAASLPFTAIAQDGVAGAYLAARAAGFSSDYAQAAKYYDQLVQRASPSVDILDAAMITYAMLGDFERAGQTATRALSLEPTLQIARMVRLVSDLQAGKISEAEAALEEGPVGGPLLDGLMRGWVQLAIGNMSGTTQAFEQLAQTDAFAPFAHIHHAFALAMVGDLESAEAILSGEAHGPLRLNGNAIAAHAQILALLGRTDDAKSVLEATLQVSSSPELTALKTELDTGSIDSFDIISSPLEGMSEALTTLAAVVNGEASDTYTLLHSRAAIALRPDNLDAILLTADILEKRDQFDLASEVLNGVPADHPAFYLAEMSRAEVLFSAERTDAAIEVLQSLTKTHGDLQSVHVALGDALRRVERHADASKAYDAAVALVTEPTNRDWFLFYVRAITFERTDRWPEAEADFRKALELNPDQPNVLNYLGYSLVEQKVKLDEALEMIKTAVEARPDDGFITDSLGWVYYRLGRYEDAVAPMERAVELQPLDPVINDHLGDVYWAVGRFREAEFQWRRALSNVDPDDENGEADPDRMRRKLEVGLDVVLKEEGAPPLRAATAE